MVMWRVHRNLRQEALWVTVHQLVVVHSVQLRVPVAGAKLPAACMVLVGQIPSEVNLVRGRRLRPVP